MAAEIFIKTGKDMFFNRSIPPICREIHSLAVDLLRQPHWILRKQHIANLLEISLRTVNRYFNLLVKMGLALYDAKKDRWHVFKSPKARNSAPSSVVGLPPEVVVGLPPEVDNIKNNTYREKTTTQPPSEPIITPDPVTPAVVVFSGENLPGTDHDPIPIPEGDPLEPEPTPLHDPEPIPEPVKEPVELKYPEQLTPKQKSDIKHHIKKAPIEHRQAILSTLAHYLALGTIRTPIGWVRSRAEEAAKTGEFTPVGAASATITYNPDNDPTQARLKAERAKPKPDPEKAKTGVLQAKLAVRGML